MHTEHILPQELTIFSVGEWFPVGMTWLAPDSAPGAASDVLHVDASALTEVDSAGVQLLVALRNALARRDRRLVLHRPTGGLIGLCATLGLQSLVADANPLEATP